uniref:hypothetical protein n=1 Tax=Dysosmobacter welbionis TaxID=2093857 RepID=UPI003FF0B63A
RTATKQAGIDFIGHNLYFDHIKHLALHSLHCEKEKVPRQQRLPGTDGYEKKSRNLSHFCGSFLCVKRRDGSCVSKCQMV